MTYASAPASDTSRPADRPAARAGAARRRPPRGLRPEPRLRAVRDRPHHLGGARLPGRRVQPLPAGVGRLHRQHGPRQRGDVRDPARRDLRVVGVVRAARGPLRAARGLFHPRGQRRLVRPRARRALRARPAERPGHRRLDPRRRALRPLPALRGAPAGHRLGRRAGLGHAPLRRPARPAGGHGLAHRPRSAGRAGGGRGRAPPDRARATAAGLLAPVRAPFDRRGPPGGVRRRRRRAGLPEGHDRAGRPRDRGADAACGRGLGRRLARPAVARIGRRDPAAAASRLRGRGLLPRAADRGHRAHAAAHRLHLDHERARTARVGPPLARGPALRPGRARSSGASGPTTRPTGCCPRPRACRPCASSPTRR